MHEQCLLSLHKNVIQSASTFFANVQTTGVQNLILLLFLCTTAESELESPCSTSRLLNNDKIL